MGFKSMLRLFWIYKKTLFVLLVPVALLPLPLLVTSQEARCGYVMLVMALYWTTEVLPLAVTALLPMIFLPLLGVMTAGDVAINYMKDTNMMMIGGLTVALAIEKCNLHRRIALGVLRLVGAKPQWLMIGFMLPTWFLSMWISNTATTAMMIPVVEAVLQELEDSKTEEDIPGLNTKPPDDPTKPKSIVHRIGVENEAYTERDELDLKQNHANGDIKLHHIGDGHIKENSNVYIIKDRSLESVPGEAKGNFLDLEAQRSSSKSQKEDGSSTFREMCKGFTLCICYAANAGGTATITGTGPNLVLKGQVDEIWQSKGVPSPINFSTWIIFGLPGSAILLLITWIWLMVFFLGWRKVLNCSKDGDPEKEEAVKDVIRRQYTNLGPMRFDEAAVAAFFVLLVLLWFFRQPEFMPGWGSLFRQGYTADAVPALVIAVILYFFPSRPPWKLGNEADARGPAPALMTWDHYQVKMPWGVILLLGGGFALAKASQVSRLSDLIADKLSVFRNLPGFVLVFILCFMVALLTEVTSNSATATILLPIMASLAQSIGKNPLYLMLPVAVSTSFAYMLPVATPPNAIAFSYGRIRVIDMVKAGALLNVLAVVVVTIGTHTWGMAFFKFDIIPWDTNPLNATAISVLSTQTL